MVRMISSSGAARSVLRLGKWGERSHRCEHGSAPGAVLAVLREVGEPMTAGEVWRQLGEGWLLVTVQAALKRLARAGRLVKLPAHRPRFALP